jgi:hypothetical protein
MLPSVKTLRQARPTLRSQPVSRPPRSRLADRDYPLAIVSWNRHLYLAPISICG